ncbi:hypothetical protein M378DRAFT_966706 [Amanita muscaria Koide BX008]|uniref:Uncharacterized protein n=1 Tax=Amanita muscaria (strain Koide BX008) TaxID=946122 RepID=A0A0C2WU75_AMAMK|nr:hypothetical protein M378DRAFT_966706 [Amanita muscaria Koide BX008]
MLRLSLQLYGSGSTLSHQKWSKPCGHQCISSSSSQVHLVQEGGDSSSTTHIQRCGSLSDVNDTDLLRSNHISYLIHALDAPWLPFIGNSKNDSRVIELIYFTRRQMISNLIWRRCVILLIRLLRNCLSKRLPTSNLSISASTSPRSMDANN